MNILHQVNMTHCGEDKEDYFFQNDDLLDPFIIKLSKGIFRKSSVNPENGLSIVVIEKED